MKSLSKEKSEIILDRELRYWEQYTFPELRKHKILKLFLNYVCSTYKQQE